MVELVQPIIVATKPATCADSEVSPIGCSGARSVGGAAGPGGMIGTLIDEPAQPCGAGLRVVVFNAAVGLQHFIRAHRGVADEDELV